MRTDFSLNDWIEIWMMRLSPIVDRGLVKETLIDKYERTVENFLYGTRSDGTITDPDKIMPDPEQYKAYRERLLGPDLIVGVPDEYAILGIIDKVGYLVWQEMELQERAKYIAYYRLENMAELLREHLRLQKQLEEEKSRSKK